MNLNAGSTRGRAESWPDETQRHTELLRGIAWQRQAALAQLEKVNAKAKDAADSAIAAGMSEVEVARALGVDRARTLRRWLGK